ncbi:MAG TPA: IS630 family transposase [Terracidiphilus sp.]|nr:IS630 family transposase [Terracidiphilus sp.]
MPLPPAPRLAVSDADRKELLSFSRQRSIPRGILLRVNIVLGAAEGLANHLLARELSTTVTTVLLWRNRYEAEGMPGLFFDRQRSGRPKQISVAKEAAIVEATMRTTPTDATHWSVRAMAARQKVSPATVVRIWKRHKLQPHRVESFKFSNDPDFAPKVRDIVGLYLNPPDNAIVLSVDEKSQIQALDRTQPILPLRPGLPERQTHDYQRHGTTTLFAALNVLEGTVIGQCQQRHRHQEFLKFLNRIERSVEAELDIHLVLDNYGTHKHPQVKQWLAERPRYHVHFTPTSSSWLNQVERWFAEITRKRIRRGTFRSVRDLVKTIEDYIRLYNGNARPFQWVASASRIIRKVNKYRRISESTR